MKLFRTILIVIFATIIAFAALPSSAQQSAPSWTFNYVPTPAEWAFWFGKKTDWTGAAPCTVTGCTFTGPISTTSTSAPTDTAGQTSMTGTIVVPSLTGLGQGLIYNTTASGLTFQGIGTSNDMTWRGKSGTQVCANLTGTTNILCGGLEANTATAPTLIAGQTFIGGPMGNPTLVNGSGAMFNSSTGGLILQGQGSNNDIAIRNSTGSNVFAVPTGTVQIFTIGPLNVGSTAPATNGQVNIFGSTSGSSSILVGSTGGLVLANNQGGQNTIFNDGGNGTAIVIGVAGGTIANQVTIKPALTTVAPSIAATGSDTNTNLKIDGKGTGTVFLATVSTGGLGFNVGSDATGDVYYRNSGGTLSRVGIGSSNQVLTVVSGLPAWASAGSGTVTSVTIAAGQGISVSGTCTITTTGTCTVASNLSNTSNTLGADVALNNTASFFDGPSAAQGTSGTWLATGQVQVFDSVAAAIVCKLWDGTTVKGSGQVVVTAGGVDIVSLSGIFATPAGNIRISCKDVTATTGKILFNQTGTSVDSTISVVRIQ